MMTKQHYIETAKALYESKASDETINNMAQMFARDNPRFDLARFRAACKEGMIQARSGTKPRKAF